MKKILPIFVISLFFLFGFMFQSKATSYSPEIEITDYKVKKLTISIEAPTSPETFGGIDYYILEYSKNSSYANAKTVTLAADATGHILTDLTSASAYYLRLTAYYNDDYDSHDSVWGSTNQNKPKKLKAKKKTNRTARLKWLKPVRNLSGTAYRVKLYSKKGKLKEDLVVYGRNYVDVTGLAKGHKYYFRAKAKIRSNSGNYGKWSKKKYFRTTSVDE